MTERELDRLKHALTLLSEAEKHLRVSSERSTWFTATLLQLGSVSSPDRTQSTSSRHQSSKATEEDHISMPREAIAPKQRTDAQFAPEKSGSPTSFQVAAHCNSTGEEKQVARISKPNQSQFIDGEELTVSHDDCTSGTITLTCMDSKILINIWLQCIEKCHSKTLRQLLHSYGKLVSISKMKGKVTIQKNGHIENHTSAFPFLSSPALWTNSLKVRTIIVFVYVCVCVCVHIGFMHVQLHLSFSEASSRCNHSV